MWTRDTLVKRNEPGIRARADLRVNVWQFTCVVRHAFAKYGSEKAARRWRRPPGLLVQSLQLGGIEHHGRGGTLETAVCPLVRQGALSLREGVSDQGDATNLPAMHRPQARGRCAHTIKRASHVNAAAEACPRKRKKEGLNLQVGRAQPGCTGSTTTGSGSLREVCERVRLRDDKQRENESRVG